MLTNKERREHQEDRHTLSVHLMGTRLIAMCKCGAIVGGNRERDANVISMYDLIQLTVQHSSQINRRR